MRPDECPDQITNTHFYTFSQSGRLDHISSAVNNRLFVPAFELLVDFAR